MTSCKTIMVTSCKGGVGKSTVSANLAGAFAKRQKKVLLIDLDLGMRCLDLILGCENKAVYDISDAVCDGIPFDKVTVQASEGIDFCAAPYRSGVSIDAARFKMIIDGVKNSGKYDYMIIDTPGDIGEPFELAAAVCDAALIIASHAPSTIRAAEHTGRELERRGTGNVRLIVNNFDTSDTRGISSGERPGLIDIIDRTYLRLLGVIPYDAAFARLQERGLLADRAVCRNVTAAFDNIARRIEGEQVVIFERFKKISRRKLM